MKGNKKEEKPKGVIEYQLTADDILHGILKGFPMEIINTNTSFSCRLPNTIVNKLSTFRPKYHNGLIYNQCLYLVDNILEDYLEVWLKMYFPRLDISINDMIYILTKSKCLVTTPTSITVKIPLLVEARVNTDFYVIPLSKLYNIQGG